MSVLGRIPIIALSYDERDKAVPKELLVDYDTGKIYVVSSHDKTIIYDLTDKIAEYLSEYGFSADSLTVNVEGVGEVDLETAINDINKSVNPSTVSETGSLAVINENGELTASTMSIENTMSNTYESWLTNASDLSITRAGLAGSGDTGNAMLAVGGYSENASNLVTTGEEFIGITWSNSADINIGRYGLKATGNTNRTAIFGGIDSAGNIETRTEIFDGISWTILDGADLLTARKEFSSCGGGLSALVISGRSSDNEYVTSTERFNGNSWSVSVDVVSARSNATGFGITTDALLVAGKSDNRFVGTSEVFNGNSWSTHDSSVSVLREAASGSSHGSFSESIIFGGIVDIATMEYTDTCEVFNGDVWTNVMNSNIRRAYLGSGGTSTDALAFGGLNDTTSSLAFTEKYAKTELKNGLRIIDDCNCPVPDAVLSAKQGAVLNNKIEELLNNQMKIVDIEYNI